MQGSWPDPDDAIGWGRVVETGGLARCEPGRLVAALRALAHTADERLVNAIAARLSELVIRRLRAAIGTDHPNRGEDMILRAHGAIFEAILDPASADGAELAENYGARSHFRGIDTVRVERRHHSRHPSYDAGEDILARACAPGVLGAMTVEQLLTRIPDLRKRLALPLMVEGMQIRTGDPCVASVLDVNPTTAAKWIVQARAVLRAQSPPQHASRRLAHPHKDPSGLGGGRKRLQSASKGSSRAARRGHEQRSRSRSRRSEPDNAP